MTKKEKKQAKKEFLRKDSVFTKEELQYMKNLHTRYGNTVTVSYQGSGDSFDSFYSVDGADNSFLEAEGVNDLLWKAIESTQADFNDDGSTGKITFNLKNQTINIENYHIIQREELSDAIDLS